MGVELAAAGEGQESTNRPACVCRVGKEQHVGSGSRRADGPRRAAPAHDAERVRDRDALKAEARVEEPVSRRLENGAAGAERRVDAVADHDAGNIRLDGAAVGRQIRVANMAAHVRPVVGRDAQGAEARKVFRARCDVPGGKPARERDAEERRPVLTCPERTVGRSSTGARSTCTPLRRRARAVASPAAYASAFLPMRRAPSAGGSSRNARTSPPSWSTKTNVSAGRGAFRSHRCTSTPPTPAGAGRPETTTSAAFCCGVRPISAAVVSTVATPNTSVD
jgi:hypothetical protein